MRPSRLAALAAILVGMAFVTIGLLRPAVLWDMPKVRAGRDAFGETGMTLFFVFIGALLVAAGKVLARKR